MCVSTDTNSHISLYNQNLCSFVACKKNFLKTEIRNVILAYTILNTKSSLRLHL